MALFAGGGMMGTKSHASGGACINKMSDSCRSCRFDPKLRAGPDACPHTTLYGELIARNAESLATNHRMARPLAAAAMSSGPSIPVSGSRVSPRACSWPVRASS